MSRLHFEEEGYFLTVFSVVCAGSEGLCLFSFSFLSRWKVVRRWLRSLSSHSAPPPLYLAIYLAKLSFFDPWGDRQRHSNSYPWRRFYFLLLYVELMVRIFNPSGDACVRFFTSVIPHQIWISKFIWLLMLFSSCFSVCLIVRRHLHGGQCPNSLSSEEERRI